jgi:protein tyrosine/serine phosphatase
MFERYLADAEPKGISFIDWVKSDAYDPAAMKADFRAGWWGSLLTEKILRRE